MIFQLTNKGAHAYYGNISRAERNTASSLFLPKSPSPTSQSIIKLNTHNDPMCILTLEENRDVRRHKRFENRDVFFLQSQTQ